MSGDAEKPCSKCGDPHGELFKLCPPCRLMLRLSNARYRKANPDKIKAKNAARACGSERSPEQISKKKERDARRYAAAPQMFREKGDLWRKANPDKVRAADARYRTTGAAKISGEGWRQRNPDKVKEVRAASYRRKLADRLAKGIAQLLEFAKDESGGACG